MYIHWGLRRVLVHRQRLKLTLTALSYNTSFSAHGFQGTTHCGVLPTGSSQVLPTAQWPQLVTRPNLIARGDEEEESQIWWFLYSLSHYVLWICVHCVSITISLETWSTKLLLKKQEKKGVFGLVYRVEFDKRILMSYRSFHIL